MDTIGEVSRGGTVQKLGNIPNLVKNRDFFT